MEHKYCFTFASEKDDCGILLYDRNTGALLKKLPFSAGSKVGRVHRLEVDKESLPGELLYQFYEGERRYADPKGRGFFAAKKYGEAKGEEDIYTLLKTPCFDWRGSRNPGIPYEDSLIYCLHVRGFTKHVSSGVKARGTFGGVIEKIPYLKELGVTTLEFQPIYEFNERPKGLRNYTAGPEENPGLNYWGYTKGFYYAPKADYARKDAITECKEMIRALHENQMEIVLQFYFPEDFNPLQIPDILRFWVEEYHVDGFHLIGENLPGELLAQLPELADTKLWYYQMDTQRIYGNNNLPGRKTLGLVRDDFLYDARRFLKGEEGMIPGIMYHLRAVPAAIGRIHYLSTYWGFTLMDMVSYDFKHNEANGEENHDGTDYNCSWNCGEEGFSRKKKIQRLRIQQIKNALCLLFFAQSTPRIFMGDEFGNSQRGNNNPYCQDNDVTWLNWRNLEKYREIHSFFRQLKEFRAGNSVLHPAKETSMMDSISCGYPDYSYHGMTAWRPQMENYSRQLGVQYCGLYGEKRTHDFIYLGMNMHWEPHSLAFPRLPKGKRWVPLFSTSEEMTDTECGQDMILIRPKTIAVFVSEDKDNGKDLETLKDDNLS